MKMGIFSDRVQLLSLGRRRAFFRRIHAAEQQEQTPAVREWLSELHNHIRSEVRRRARPRAQICLRRCRGRCAGLFAQRPRRPGDAPEARHGRHGACSGAWPIHHSPPPPLLAAADAPPLCLPPRPQSCAFLENFQYAGKIGEGEYGEVHLVRDRSGKAFALKMMESTEHDAQYIVSEALLWRRVDSCSVARLYDAFCIGPLCFFLLELGGVTLDVWMQKKVRTSQHCPALARSCRSVGLCIC
jgi:hypothetical protein